MESPRMRVSRHRKPATLRYVWPSSMSKVVPRRTQGSTVDGSTRKLAMAKYRHCAERNGLMDLGDSFPNMTNLPHRTIGWRWDQRIAELTRIHTAVVVSN